MPYLIRILAISILLLSAACQPPEADLTASEKANIESEVLAVFHTMVDGMNEHDAGKILGCYLDGEPLRYAVDGELLLGRAAFEERVVTGHSDPDEYWPVFVTDTYVDVLTPEIALVTARGETERIGAAGDTLRSLYAITDVFQRTEAGWKVVNEHESGFSVLIE